LSRERLSNAKPNARGRRCSIRLNGSTKIKQDYYFVGCIWCSARPH
jgi:hypothetical protein